MHCRIATEAEAEASKADPAAETAIQTARQAAMTLRGQPQELTMPYLHDLAAYQLQSWLAKQKNVSAFQVLPCRHPLPQCITQLRLQPMRR